MQNKVHFTDPGRGYLEYRDEIDAAVRRVLESGWYILGSEVKAFEEAFARYCGVPHAIGVANGTDAIHLALRALGVGPGDAVFTVSHTATATIAGIEMSGATPVFVDVHASTYTIDPEKLADTVKAYRRNDSGLRPRAVVAVHLYGHPCHLNELRAICDEHDLLLIEDCAQAHGATYHGKLIGSFGDAAAFSFYPTKNLAAFGDGGAVVLADSEAARRCRALREYGWYTRYVSEVPGVNSRLDELQAAILSVRLSRLNDEVRRRQAVAARYSAALGAFVTTPAIQPACEHAYHLYVIRTSRRDELQKFLASRGIGTGIHYPHAVHEQSAYSGRIAIGSGGLQVTEQVVKEVLSLPMHPFLSPPDLESVINAISQWKGSVGTGA